MLVKLYVLAFVDRKGSKLTDDINCDLLERHGLPRGLRRSFRIDPRQYQELVNKPAHGGDVLTEASGDIIGKSLKLQCEYSQGRSNLVSDVCSKGLLSRGSVV